ncbi:MAG: lipid-A-disaccharide synthase [Chlamydiales bacterium]|nr:lipid-A-disaccharide synthase [Chlamydiales bacterium]
MQHYDFFIIAAEPSADIHGEEIIQALLLQDPSLKIAAIAGPYMRKYPIDVVFSMEQFQVMGFIDVLLSLPRMIPLFFQVRKKTLQINPKVVLFIDYPGFNIRMAKHLKQKGFKGTLVQYVCPTVWAWKKSLIPIIAHSLDLLIPLFPFEKKCFSDTSLKVEFLGHPLVHKTEIYRKQHQQIDKSYITIFPGSRKKEIIRNFPTQLAVARELAKKYHLQIAVVSAQEALTPLISSIALQKEQVPMEIIPSELRYGQMQKTKLAIAKSGTITLELALMQVPTVVNFAIKPLDEWIATKIFKINLPFYCIVNILANRELFPEFFGSNMKLPSLFDAADNILSHLSIYDSIINDCAEIKELLTDKNAKESIAKTLLDSLHQQKV